MHGILLRAGAGARMPDEDLATAQGLARQGAAYREATKAARRQLVGRFKVDGKQLDAIDKEGFETKWPLGER